MDSNNKKSRNQAIYSVRKNVKIEETYSFLKHTLILTKFNLIFEEFLSILFWKSILEFFLCGTIVIINSLEYGYEWTIFILHVPTAIIGIVIVTSLPKYFNIHTFFLSDNDSSNNLIKLQENKAAILKKSLTEYENVKLLRVYQILVILQLVFNLIMIIYNLTEIANYIVYPNARNFKVFLCIIEFVVLFVADWYYFSWFFNLRFFFDTNLREEIAKLAVGNFENFIEFLIITWNLQVNELETSVLDHNKNKEKMHDEVVKIEIQSINIIQ